MRVTSYFMALLMLGILVNPVSGVTFTFSDETGDVRNNSDVNFDELRGIDITGLEFSYEISDASLSATITTLDPILTTLSGDIWSIHYTIDISGGTGCYIENCLNHYSFSISYNVSKEGLTVEYFTTRDYHPDYDFRADIKSYSVVDNQLTIDIDDIDTQYNDLLSGKMRGLYYYDVFSGLIYNTSDSELRAGSDRLYHFEDKQPPFIIYPAIIIALVVLLVFVWKRFIVKPGQG